MFPAIIVFPVIALLVALYFVRGKPQNTIAIPVVTVILTFVVTAMIGLVVLACSPGYYHRVEKDRTEIVPFPTSTASGGLVRLVNVRGVSYYFFYKKFNGGKISERIRTDRAVLYKDVQGKGSHAYVANLYLEKRWRGGSLFDFFAPIPIRTNIKKIGYAIHVPGGAITE